jgi:hypothetical protein
MGERKYIDREHLEERIALRTEHIRNPTPKQLHDALNATLEDLREVYGEVDVPQWPRATPSSNTGRTTNEG